MSNAQASAVPSIPAAETAKPRHLKRRLLRGLLLYAVLPYLGVAAMLTFFQRSLIYQGSRVESVPLSMAGRAGNVHAVQITTHDGLGLNGWLFLAEGRTVENEEQCNRELCSGRSLVLYFPGNAGNRSHRASDCRDFTDLGANVVLVDYRGYADNPGAPTEEMLAADAMSIWREMTERRGVAADKLIVFGESLGGGVATRLASELCAAGNSPACLIVTSTFSSLVEAAKYHYPFLPVQFLLVDRFPSVDRAAKINCPVLQIHGTVDTIVPIELSRRLWAAFPEHSKSGIAKEFVELPHAGHNDIPQSDFRASAGTFLARLGVTPQSASRE